MKSIYEDPVAPCVPIPAWVFTDGQLHIPEIALLGALLSLGGEATISQRRLAKMLNCGQETVKRYLKKLQEKRIVSITHQVNADGGKASNRYIVQPWVMGNKHNG